MITEVLMGFKKSGLLVVLFVLGLALFLVLTRHRDLVSFGLSQSPSSAKAKTMVMYALATPTDVPGLSRKSDRENEHLLGPVKFRNPSSSTATKQIGRKSWRSIQS
jgi:hypothetical protein